MIHTIQTVSDYIEEIEKLINNKKHNYYFRGQDDAFSNTLPSVFRSRKLLDNEDNMFNDFLMADPQLFEKCRTNFERMALMEHYHLPTRLLDVSTNPLIALFFAVKGGQGNGEVYIYKDRPNHDKLAAMLKEMGWPNLIAEYKVKRGLANHDYFKKNAFSNEMQLESSLARQSMADKSAFFQAIKSFYQLDNRYIAQQHRLWSDDYLNYFDSEESNYFATFKHDLQTLPFLRLFEEAKRDIPSFANKLNPLELIVPKIVTIKRMSRRMENQQGLFLFVPFIGDEYDRSVDIDYTEVERRAQMAIDVLSLYNADNSNEKEKYIIPAQYKRPILDELAKLGIDYSFIYPEDHAKKAEMIKDRYLGL
ncbi:MAG: FRG domain-containing protein [Lactobacillaceae bacterium]|nr:FRG domain-containing protein [Lactobacillaceae bacterium]